MLLHLCTWTEVESYLQGSQGIIIPIGSTEQHGPTGVLGTDAICAEKIAIGVGDIVHALVAPTINVGMALHHGAFPGTISLRPSTLMQLIHDYVISLAKTGFRSFFFINGHGGNMATLKACFAEIYHDLEQQPLPSPDLIRCELANWFMCRSVYTEANRLYGYSEGRHATPSEIAVTQHYFAEAVKKYPLLEPAARGYSIYSAKHFRQCYPDGRMGSNPALATPEAGKTLAELAIKELSERYEKFLNQSEMP
ncbi:MAG: creatininase family protein [Cyanobacteria bacterium P01_H01_bin.15]